MRKLVLVGGFIIALIGISISSGWSDVLRYQCRSAGDSRTYPFVIDTTQQTITYQDGSTLPAKITRQSIVWTDDDGDRHQIDRASGRWDSNGDRCVLTSSAATIKSDKSSTNIPGCPKTYRNLSGPEQISCYASGRKNCENHDNNDLYWPPGCHPKEER